MIHIHVHEQTKKKKNTNKIKIQTKLIEKYRYTKPTTWTSIVIILGLSFFKSKDSFYDRYSKKRRKKFFFTFFFSKKK